MDKCAEAGVFVPRRQNSGREEVEGTGEGGKEKDGGGVGGRERLVAATCPFSTAAGLPACVGGCAVTSDPVAASALISEPHDWALRGASDPARFRGDPAERATQACRGKRKRRGGRSQEPECEQWQN